MSTGAALNFNAAAVAPDEGRSAVPAGWYGVKIVASELKPTSKNDGEYLQMTLEILEGPHARRKLFDRMNLKNPNQTAVEIGQGRLSAYCHATNVIMLNNSMQLHGIPFKVKVRLKPAEGQYDESNEVTAVKPYAYSEGGAGDVSGGAAPAGGASGAPAWLAGGASGALVAAAPSAAPAPAPAAAAPVPAPVAAPVKTMTAKAGGATYEQFKVNGWTDEAMVEQGFMTIANPAPVAASAPAPTDPAPTQAGGPPPWAK